MKYYGKKGEGREEKHAEGGCLQNSLIWVMRVHSLAPGLLRVFEILHSPKY